MEFVSFGHYWLTPSAKRKKLRQQVGTIPKIKNHQNQQKINQKFLRGGPDASRGRFLQKEPPLAARGIDK
jgi:hypothetical protein